MPPAADKASRMEGAMQDSQRFSASDRANQVVFVEALGKNERALMWLMAVIAVGMACYALARVNGAVELQAARAESQATTYRLATEQLSREQENRVEALRAQFKELQTQSRVTELKLDDYNVTLRRAGIRLKGDFARGPMGNPDAKSFNMQLRKNPTSDSK